MNSNQMRSNYDLTVGSDRAQYLGKRNSTVYMVLYYFRHILTYVVIDYGRFS